MPSIQAFNVNHHGYQENLNETEYKIIRDSILAALSENDIRTNLPFPELEEKVSAYLNGREVHIELFPKPGSVRWYTKAVQLDLEARKIIERVPNLTPMRLRLA